ncbi:hypothetical protein Hanom_Chr04g00317401 [Helianthus anomalus]
MNQLVFDPWDVQFLKWRHQNLLGANTKGYDVSFKNNSDSCSL